MAHSKTIRKEPLELTLVDDKAAVKAQVLKLYLEDDLPIQEIAEIVGVSTRSVYRYLDAGKQRPDVQVEGYVTTIVENSLITLSDMSEEFRLNWREWMHKDPKICEQFLKVFDRLYDKVKDLVSMAYQNQPDAAPELPANPRLALDASLEGKTPPVSSGEVLEGVLVESDTSIPE